jgi:hypothetical protein
VNEIHTKFGPSESARHRVVTNGKRWLGVCGVCALLSVASPSRAADASDKAAAEALFEQGKSLMEQKQYGEACEKFRVSQELDAGLGTLLHLADCYEKMGRTASAWATFEEAASVAASRGDTNRHDIARGRAVSIKPHLSYVVIRATVQPPSGAVVTRDGRNVPAALWGVPVPVDPGATTIELSAPGYQTAKVEVTIPTRAPAPIEVTLPKLVDDPTAEPAPAPTEPAAAVTTTASEPSPVPPPPEPHETSSQKTIGLVLGGVGIVALGVAAVFTATGYSDYQDSLDDCSPGNENACGVDGKGLRDDARSDLNLATIVGSAGAVVLGTGVVLYVTAPASPSSTGTEALLTRGLGLGYQGVW